MPALGTATFFRKRSGYLLRFHGIADFELNDDGDCLRCHPAVDAELPWEPTYRQQVVPLQHAQQGQAVFHGGAIALDDDQVIAVLGPSGRGKSTLTAAFARRGYPFLGDDCLHLDLSDPQVHVHPQADFVRLWEDSADALGEGDATYVPGSPKPRLLASQHLPHCDRRLPLTRVYLLGEGNADTPVIEAIAPAEQLMGWTTNAFVLDIKNPEVLKRNLQAAARLVREIPMRRLDYPRRYDALEAVVDAVLADAT